MTMTTRRDLLRTIPATGAAFAVGGGALFDEGMARAAEAPPPLATHFHPRGKAPSEHTKAVLKQRSEGLPFADTRDFDELKKGFIAPMPDLKIMADAGHVAWDMERFQQICRVALRP
jgi:alkyl sulfatase BDS1-like metallo-beta-lactamase superfamily hydrolase